MAPPRFASRASPRPRDPTSAIYDIVLELAAHDENGEALYKDVSERALRKGYTNIDLDKALKEYADLNIWIVSQDRTKIRLLTPDVNL